MRYLIQFCLLGLLIFGVTAFLPPATTATLSEDTSVSELLRELGDSPPGHAVRADLPGVSVEAGRQLVTEGIAPQPGGGHSSRQSVHFVCTSCHNIVKEDPDLRYADPEARLAYAESQDIPFLPGTTLYGVVNRTSWYNDDYVKKYGDLVEGAQDDLRGAIALCATECSQGRELEDWEMESILAYLWTIDLKVGDLILTSAEKETIERAVSGNGHATAAIDLIKSRYLSYSPAHFLVPPPDRQAGYPETGRPAQGQLLYERSCLHCHGEQRYSFFNLDETHYSYDFLTKHFPRYTRYSAYQVIRYGTSPMNGKRAYMPHYTQERMSNQQVEDLRAFLAQGAGEN
ncbi:MAG: cytochrome c [Lewinella sp.]|nr:cytochrome c [Lewinella sp.]